MDTPKLTFVTMSPGDKARRSEVDRLREAITLLGPYRDEVGKMARAQLVLELVKLSGIIPDQVDVDPRSDEGSTVIHPDWRRRVESAAAELLGPESPLRVKVLPWTFGGRVDLDIENVEQPA
jgi:hypothetical protein